MTQTGRSMLDESQAGWIVTQATRAPSVNNTQPWRFHWDGHTFELIADLVRGLVVSDPEGRELVISCGAALLNLQLALRSLGLQGTVSVLPNSQDARVLAEVLVEHGPQMTDRERQWFDAVVRRHTHRATFADHRISAALEVRLQEAAASEGAALHYVNDPGPRRQVLHLARAAERSRSADEEARAETADWTPSPGSHRRDGVPNRAYSSGPPAAAPDDLPARDFDLGRDFGQVEHAAQPPGAIAVLMTDGDNAADWLRAGQALEAVLLAAATEWCFASLHSRVTEVPNLRTELRRALGTAAHPQLMLRFGYADTSPTTPRRPPEDVLDVEVLP